MTEARQRDYSEEYRRLQEDLQKVEEDRIASEKKLEARKREWKSVQTSNLFKLVTAAKQLKHSLLSPKEERNYEQSDQECERAILTPEVVLASDFSLQPDQLASVIEEINVNQQIGLRTALLHFSTRAIDPTIASLLDEYEGVVILRPRDEVTCQLLLIHHPNVLEKPIAKLPHIKPEIVKVVMETAPNDQAGGYSLRKVSRNLLDVADKRARWYPYDETVKAAIHNWDHRDLRYIKLSYNTWVNNQGKSNYSMYLDESLITKTEGAEGID
ncbi:hypothetical protein [Thalassobacillus hwangdonensis]|uniref:F-box domain-containing protein n=1 Tax=Thalassobacillus hwangdonensis TaxID=546108 RepID=A0ABW3L2Z1_9BACI